MSKLICIALWNTNGLGHHVEGEKLFFSSQKRILLLKKKLHKNTSYIFGTTNPSDGTAQEEKAGQ